MVVSLARHLYDGPLSFFIAHGFGRSYGLESGNLGKNFPGIFFSGLWPALRCERRVPTVAWITDIGNDLAYEASVETILRWIIGCVERLQEIDAKIMITDLPLATLRNVSERKYRFFRALLFPRCRLDLDELLTRAEALSDGLNALGKSREIPIFSAQTEWYGFDPIHPMRAHLVAMWKQLLGVRDELASESPLAHDSWLLRWYLRTLELESRSHFSISRRANQPNGRLWDGSSVALY